MAHQLLRNNSVRTPVIYYAKPRAQRALRSPHTIQHVSQNRNNGTNVTVQTLVCTHYCPKSTPLSRLLLSLYISLNR